MTLLHWLLCWLEIHTWREETYWDTPGHRFYPRTIRLECCRFCPRIKYVPRGSPKRIYGPISPARL